jgi:L-ascorbate metabolism protein UlaG (beta-lactamase superfamily)
MGTPQGVTDFSDDQRMSYKRISLVGTGATDNNLIYFVGTATTIIRQAGFTVLTDPNYLQRGQRAYLGHGLWSTRRTEPAFPAGGIPPPDLIDLSHLHGDHFDRVARRVLAGTTPVITTPEAAQTLRGHGFPAACGLRAWQTVDVVRDEARLRVTATPGRHALGAARYLRLPPVIGTVLEFSEYPDARPFTIYVTGDTLLFDGLRAVRERFPSIDLMLVHLGGTRILGMLVTMDGRQGADLMELIEPHTTVPIHYDDYGVFRSPLADFENEVRARDLTGQVRFLDRGDALPLPAAATHP